MNKAASTYRIQFHEKFNFQDFEKQVPYLKKLGIGAVYASPILASTPGSTHGYDGVNPQLLDPEIGTEEHFEKLTAELREAGISWIQDIVPNHLAFHAENGWLMDVLEKGRQSVFASFFDISWNSELYQGKIMVPFLGNTLAEQIEAGGLKLVFKDGRFGLDCNDQIYPVNLRTYIDIFNTKSDKPQAISQLAEQLSQLKAIEDPARFSQQWKEVIMQLASLYSNDTVKNYIDKALLIYNSDPEKITKVAEQQVYILCHWQETDSKINFRRFFTVNGLICLNIQDPLVFEQYHQLVKKWVESGIVQGLRIDHVDGLYDPTAYMQQLRETVGEDTYIVIEKILEAHEQLPESWPVQGATGYEFLAAVNNVFTNKSAEPVFNAFYEELTGSDKSVHDQLLSKKSDILYKHMGGELQNLYHLFTESQLASDSEIDAIEPELMKEAVGEILVHCPVYRYYGNEMPLSDSEGKALKSIFEEVVSYHPKLEKAIGLLEKCLLENPEEMPADDQQRALKFYQRMMQFSGPVMAKGGEDTLMYTNFRFIGHNEVGDFPDRFGMSTKDFHEYMRDRAKNWPLAMNATSTHDTKRGEDVRARLNALTDLAEKWIEKVKHWQELNAENAAHIHENDAYLIYQTITGAHPMPGQGQDNFLKRLQEYLQKALREGKVNSNWAEPDEKYEGAINSFVAELLAKNSWFRQDFDPFLEEIADYGLINSLAQVALKFTCPGIPDVYQGCELWDFSLVDPDNRRPVDYEKRNKYLNQWEPYESDRLIEKLWESRFSGEIKLWLTSTLMHFRKEHEAVFDFGEYLPLKTRGEYKDHLLAFARRFKKDCVIVIVPLHAGVLCEEQQTTFDKLDWKDTTVVLPDSLSPEWTDMLSDKVLELQTKLQPGELFKLLPLAILKGKKANTKRKAGVLLHITSLASPFGIGDLGPEAFAFADFLQNSGQSYWQLLPLNPTEASQANSPYSALSSRAGNPLLISPEILMHEGLLTAQDLEASKQKASDKVDFDVAEQEKSKLLEKAFANFSAVESNPEQEAFDLFCEQNDEWLPDFAEYIALKKRFENKPWYEWPEAFRMRDKDAVAETEAENAPLIAFVKWQQYVFDKQWKALRAYCHERDIQLLGDIPFYVSYDSADVWGNTKLFCVDEHGQITGIAGVPPDAFSEDGQLWGMPVFNWNAVKAQGYQWWIDRLKKNMELYDLIRLDHFRAFADYWEVPGGEKTAVNGTWKLGPDAEFFEKMKQALGKLPFIAEDLGEITPEVYQLRDKFALPGMKVMQFAFDENMPQSDHIPHNYEANFIAYTGTHDNNTTRGWYKEVEERGEDKRLEAYVGHAVNEETICAEMARLVYASVANVVILPMQDVLNLDEKAKMNLPGSRENNWAWRLLPGQVTSEAEQFLRQLAIMYNRE